MRFSADTDWLDSPPATTASLKPETHGLETKSSQRQQPHGLVADVLLEIMGWLAFMDWLVCSDQHRYSQHNKAQICETRDTGGPGYNLIRATHVCKYWRVVALENRSLWRYIPLSETLSRDYLHIDQEFACRVQRSIGLTKARTHIF